MTEKLDLKPCPHCGGTKLDVCANAVDCMDCGASVNTGERAVDYPDQRDAIAAWNRRAIPLSAALRKPASPVGMVLVPAKNLLELRDALAKGDQAEAYHILYGIASPNFDKFEPWEELERAAAPQQEGE